MKPKSLEIFIPGPAGRLEAKYYNTTLIYEVNNKRQIRSDGYGGSSFI